MEYWIILNIKLKLNIKSVILPENITENFYVFFNKQRETD